jgi:hypothetical protein
MRYILLILVTAFVACASKNERDLLVGDLGFSEFRIGNFYNLSDSLIKRVKHTIDTINIAKADSMDRRFFEVYNILKDKGLLYKPFVDIRVKEDSMVKLYLDSADYDRIKIFKWRELLNDEKKVVIKVKTEYIDNFPVTLLYCKELVDVSLTEGKTYPQRSKFKIEDYN